MKKIYKTGNISQKIIFLLVIMSSGCSTLETSNNTSRNKASFDRGSYCNSKCGNMCYNKTGDPMGDVICLQNCKRSCN